VHFNNAGFHVCSFDTGLIRLIAETVDCRFDLTGCSVRVSLVEAGNYLAVDIALQVGPAFKGSYFLDIVHAVAEC
jgi:hypothetical protein